MGDTKKNTSQTDTPGAPDVPRKLSGNLNPQGTAEQAEQGKASSSEPLHASSASSPHPEDDVREVVESKQTDEAVEDIVRNEGDELLEVQDSAMPRSSTVKPKKSRWWKRKWFLWTVALVLLVVIAACAAIPTLRYAILNGLGVRVSASVVVVDGTTGQPLKHVGVQIGEVKAETNEKGEAALERLRLGPQQLVIERIAFAKVERNVTLGWGSNPLGTFRLDPAGAQYTFYVRDFLSGKPIAEAEVAAGRAVAISDDEGKAVLTVERPTEDEIAVTLSASDYRTDAMQLRTDATEDTNVTLVPSNKAVFAARGDNGRYNIYSMYIDGGGREVLLEGTGHESGDIALAVSPDGQRAAIVSTREDIRGEDGALLQSLTLVNVQDGTAQTLDRAAAVRLIDWVGNVLVYQMTMPGVAADSTDRQRLVSYDYRQDKRAQLATATEFASVASAQGEVYYSAAVADAATGEFVRVNPNGSGRRTILQAAVLHAYRTDYGTLALQASDGWYRLTLGSDTTAKLNTPGSTNSRIYVANRDGTRSLWVDGATLNAYNAPDNTDAGIHTQAGLVYPVRWLTDTAAVYRVGSVDYVISTDGGDAHSITSVIPTTGLVQAY